MPSSDRLWTHVGLYYISKYYIYMYIYNNKYKMYIYFLAYTNLNRTIMCILIINMYMGMLGLQVNVLVFASNHAYKYGSLHTSY